MITRERAETTGENVARNVTKDEGQGRITRTYYQVRRIIVNFPRWWLLGVSKRFAQSQRKKKPVGARAYNRTREGNERSAGWLNLRGSHALCVSYVRRLARERLSRR